MADTLFTIGYSGFSVRTFISTLQKNNITLLADVRSLPYSRRHPDYNQDVLSAVLKEYQIRYQSYAAEFGARQEDRRYYPNGYLDFEQFSKSDPFLSGVRTLAAYTRQGGRAALMCSEIEPSMCHRSILAARAFHRLGFRILHLLPGGRAVTQRELEEELLNKYFPNRGQLNLFEKELSLQEYIDAAYKKQNALIGFRI